MTHSGVTAAFLSACLLTALSYLRPAAAAAEVSCEGDACQQVTLTFDEARQQYRARNDSADRWVRVTASNLAASAAACLGPGRIEDLPLRSLVGAYRAEYAEPRCGAAGPGR